MVSAGPPPGSFEPLPRVQAVLMRLYPKPGILTHISRGMESIPAVFVTGSTVSRINVSVQNGQSPSIGSPPRRPTNRMLMRLPPSQVGYSISSDAKNSGVEVASGVLCLRPMTGVSSGFAEAPSQLDVGIPGRDVSRQQMVNPRTKWYSPNAVTSATPQKRTQRTG